MASFQIMQSPLPEENNEFNLSNLYLFHTHSGPKRNQFAVTSKGPATGMGEIAVNNWEICDGVGKGTTIVARAQGMHIHAGNWTNVFSIVFENERFRGSTLQVMGISVDENGEFAIVGGTGQFTMATGVISKKLHQRSSNGTIVQLAIHGFSPVLKGWSPPPRPVKKIGPFGGGGGVLQDITELPGRLESITVQSGVVIDSIAFSYVDQAGQKRTAGTWGGSGRNSETIPLGPSEFVKGISGTVGLYRSCKKVVASLTFVTNVKTYGPFGLGDGTPFTVPVEGNHSVVGFFARSKTYVDAIGVYVQPQ